jgi:hypothetical protein
MVRASSCLYSRFLPRSCRGIYCLFPVIASDSSEWLRVREVITFGSAGRLALHRQSVAFAFTLIELAKSDLGATCVAMTRF